MSSKNSQSSSSRRRERERRADRSKSPRSSKKDGRRKHDDSSSKNEIQKGIEKAKNRLKSSLNEAIDSGSSLEYSQAIRLRQEKQDASEILDSVSRHAAIERIEEPGFKPCSFKSDADSARMSSTTTKSSENTTNLFTSSSTTHHDRAIRFPLAHEKLSEDPEARNQRCYSRYTISAIEILMIYRRLFSFLIQNVRHYSLESSNNYKNVRVRFAPSPTGQLHLGSLRTALFNYLFAKKYGGSFLLRIEDTDRDRLVEGTQNEFENVLAYFGLSLDEGPSIDGNFGPYVQSERYQIYKNEVERLIEENKAYKCFCSVERLDILRRKALNEKKIPRYDRHCRNLSKEEIVAREKNGEIPVVRFKYDAGEMSFKDIVFGVYSTSWDEVDFIILKRDGFPTYHFANVVDDHYMEISDVIRGSEWLLSTPKHLKLYETFNWKEPRFTHLPLITEDGKNKLSKRKSHAFVSYYTNLGYLPLAVLNFLLRNGSGIKGYNLHKLYTIDEMVANFDQNLIGRSTFMLDLKELDRYGRMAFQASNFEKDLLPCIQKQFSLLPETTKTSINPQLLTSSYFNKVISFLHLNEEKFCKMSDITTEKIVKYFQDDDIKKVLKILKKLLDYSKLDRNKINYEQIKLLAKEEKEDFSAGKITTIFRLAIIDNISGPPIHELVKFFGTEEISTRLEKMVFNLEGYLNNYDDVKKKKCEAA
uniref:Nondiscriminating glutamyl-tRNA synthetase EARS2, mitochondrial n=1 Tax=Meloidogyne javanica TaxID=6303 RepID=A0A915LPP5_MELJA